MGHFIHSRIIYRCRGIKVVRRISGKHWFYGPFPIAWHSLNISFLELFPITLAVHIWGATMANSCVLFFTDNAALVDIINKQTSKHKQVMILIRDLVLSCLKYNIISS